MVGISLLEWDDQLNANTALDNGAVIRNSVSAVGGGTSVMIRGGGIWL